MRTNARLDEYFSVDLQEPFSYSALPIILTICLIAVSLLVLLIIHLAKKVQHKPKVIQEPEREVLPLPELKGKYLYMVGNLETRYRMGEITEKFAYEELSSLTRHFVYDATDIKVQNYSLDEISKIGMPSLNALIKECYPPEFEPGQEGNILASINHAREVVAQWN